MHRHVADAHTAQLLARMVPVLYNALGQLPAAELAAAAAVLEGGRPSVWVGNGFVSASRVAFKVRAKVDPFAAAAEPSVLRCVCRSCQHTTPLLAPACAATLRRAAWTWRPTCLCCRSS